MPKVGDTVFVNEVDVNTGEAAVSPALITYVYTEDDAGQDKAWWNAAKENGICDVTVLRRNGSVGALTVSKYATVQDDDGNDVWQNGTYSDTVDNAPAQPASTGAVGDATPAEPQDTVGDGTAPQGSSTDSAGNPVI